MEMLCIARKTRLLPCLKAGVSAAQKNDDISIKEAMDLLDHFGIEYAEYQEPASELGRQGYGTFKSKINPPSQSDLVYGQYFKPEVDKLKK